MPDPSLLVAHQGGWDEILLVVIPIVVIVGLLAVAKRRIGAANAATTHEKAHEATMAGTADGDD